MSRKYLYGPVPSRRLGRSLGIDPFGRKTCTYNCIYCQLGAGQTVNSEMSVAFPTADEVFAEIKTAIDSGIPIDCITFCGSGEPTLWDGLGATIDAIKASFKNVKVCIITNSSVLWKKTVFARILNADIIIPTISAYDENTYTSIHRSHESATFAKTKEGLFNLARNFSGEIWAEVMLIRDFNDSVEALMKLSALISLCNVKYIDVNTPVRPSAERNIYCPNEMTLATAKVIFGAKCRIIGAFAATDDRQATIVDMQTAILDIVRRRPERASNIAAALMVGEQIVENTVMQLIEDGVVFRDAEGYLRLIYNT